MARYYTLQIGTVYLTDTGLAGGVPCRLRISPVESLRVTYAGQTAPSADGTPYTVAFAVGTKGRPLVVSVDYLPKAVFDSVVALINTALQNNTTITLIGTGDLGNFNLAAVPALPIPVKADGGFSNSILRGVEFSFVTAS